MSVDNSLMQTLVSMLERSSVRFIEKDDDGTEVSTTLSALLMSTSDRSEKIKIIERSIDLLEADAYLTEATKMDLKSISRIDVGTVKKFFKELKSKFRKLMATVEADVIPDTEYDKIVELEKMLRFNRSINE